MSAFPVGAQDATNTFYFQSTLAGTGPSGEVSTDTDDFPNDPAGKNTPLLMSVLPGVAQTSLAQAYTTAVASKSLIRIWVTPALDTQILRGSQSGYQIRIGAMESNAGMDLYPPRAFVYVWRSGAGNVFTIIGATSGATECTTAERGFIITATGNAGDFQLLEGDRIVVEIWADIRNVLSTPYTSTWYWGGPTDIVHNVANVNVASLFYSPQSLDIYTAPETVAGNDVNGYSFGLLTVAGIITTIFYWIRRTLVPGLLSVLLMFGAGSYWLVLDTSLPILAWAWYAIALVNLFDFIIRVAYTFGNVIADHLGYRWDFLRSDDEA